MSFVQKAVTKAINNYSVWIRVFLKGVANRTVANRRGIQIPGNRMAAAPMPIGLSAALKRHGDAVPCVEPGARHFDKIPARAQVLCTHFGIGLEAATGQDYRLGAHSESQIAIPTDAHAIDLAGLSAQANCSSAVPHVNSRLPTPPLYTPISQTHATTTLLYRTTQQQPQNIP